MLIEFTDDFLEALELESTGKRDKAILLINDALHKMLHRSHIVFVSAIGVKSLLNNDSIDLSNKRILCWIREKALDLNAIKNKSKIIVQLTFGSSCSFGDVLTRRLYWKINVNDLDEFKESVLITENATDYDFYYNIANWYFCSSFFELHLKNIASNGANADTTILTRDKEKDFSCCIFDSDKDFQDAADGATLKNAQEGEKNRTNKFLPFFLYALPVREKENIFPYKEYLKISNIQEETKKLIDLLIKETDKELLSFFDLKDGIKLKKIREGKSIKKWYNLYWSFIEKCARLGVCKSNIICESCGKDTCKKCNNRDNKYIAGIGDKLLSSASNIFFKEKSKKFLVSSELDNIFNNQKFILDIWQSISDLLFDFGCSISRSINFII